MARKNRAPEENARREKILELLQMANIGSMDDMVKVCNFIISVVMLLLTSQIKNLHMLFLELLCFFRDPRGMLQRICSFFDQTGFLPHHISPTGPCQNK